ncbi:hypothetical protein D3C75_743750 [compost metagenome]
MAIQIEMRNRQQAKLTADHAKHPGELRENQHALAGAAAFFNNLQQLLKFA